jgi:hypothetical protein
MPVEKLEQGCALLRVFSEAGVEVLVEHVKNAFDNGSVRLEPQRSGGQALPSAIETQIADMVKHLMEQHKTVFPGDVLKWALEAIEETDYAEFFPDGKPTRGWFYGWLRRIEFLIGNLRPLE